MNELFFELIQIAIGSRVCLSHTPSADEWKQLYEMAKKQSLVGVCFAGVQKLQLQKQCPDEMLYLTWMGMAAKIQQRNEVVNRQCVEVQNMLAEKGFRSCIFKGQAVASLYHSLPSQPSSLSALRQSGDIDIWIEGGKKRVIDLVQEIAPTKEIRETHAHLDVFPDTEVEAHYRPGLIRNFVKNAKLQKFFQEEAEACFSNMINISNPSVGELCRTTNSSNHSEPLTIVAPTTQFNLVHQLTHIYHHLFTEGVGLRQVMDYYMVLRTVSSFDSATSTSLSTSQEPSFKFQVGSRVQEVIKSLGLERFASALMWVIAHVFEGNNHLKPAEGDETLKPSETASWMLWTPNEKDGRFLLGEIIQSGNFGKYDERHDFRNMNVVQSLFRITGKNLSYLRFAPFDWFWSPLWRGYHYCSRKINGYK